MLNFSDALSGTGISLDEVRLLRHSDPNSRPGHSPYEIWRDQRDLFERYQSEQGLNAHKRLQKSRYWASFVATPANETMFVGLYKAEYIAPSPCEITVVTTGVRYDPETIYMYRTEMQRALSEYGGRLFIEWGEGFRAWVQRATTHKPIVELRPEFKEPDFPGYIEFLGSLSSVPGMPATWRVALQNARGVYVLTCPRTKELYVGSAYGADGFYGRWLQYAMDGYGGNVQLRSRERSDYQVAILEVVGTNARDEDVILLESRWKNKLQTRAMGLNSN